MPQINWQPFQDLYQELSSKWPRLFQCLNRISDYLQQTIVQVNSISSDIDASGLGISNYCVAYNPTNASVIAAQAVKFGTNLVDTASIHSTSVNTDRFVAPNKGFYLLGGQVQIAGDDGTGTERDVQLWINGNPVNPFSGMGTNLGPFQTISVHPPVNLAVPDFTMQCIGFLKLNKSDYMQVRYGSDSGTLNAQAFNSAWGTLIQLA